MGAHFRQAPGKFYRGSGAELTEFGQKLFWAEQLVQARLTPDLESVCDEIERAMSRVIEASATRLAICASHDLALAQLRDRLARVRLETRSALSRQPRQLGCIVKGHCGVARFHFAEGMEPSASAMFRRYLKPRKHRLIGLATRTQG